MKHSRKDILCHKLVALSQLMLDTIDELQPTNKLVQEKKQDVIDFCEMINGKILDTDTVQKTTYFPELTQKIDYIMNKYFNHKM
jgi:hypothetical protein